MDEVAIGLEELECCTKRAVVVPGLGVDSLMSCCCASASVEVAWSAIDGLYSGIGSANAGSCCVGCFGAHGVPCCWFSSCSSYLKSCCSLLIVLALMTPSVVPTNDSPLLSSTPSQIALCSAKSPLTEYCFSKLTYCVFVVSFPSSLVACKAVTVCQVSVDKPRCVSYHPWH